MKWDHMVFDLRGDEKAQTKDLQALGRDGWELVGVVPLHLCQRAYLKRPKREIPGHGASDSAEITVRKQKALEILHNESLDQAERLSLALDVACDTVVRPGDELWEMIPKDLQQRHLKNLRITGLLEGPGELNLSDISGN